MVIIKLSIIIPYYNGQDTILNCMDSILAMDIPQNEYEIIIVDDCSPIPAKTVLADYMAKFSNIQIVRHNVNKRQGGAKNTGISYAKGQYIAFADQDDVIINNNYFTIMIINTIHTTHNYRSTIVHGDNDGK